MVAYVVVIQSMFVQSAKTSISVAGCCLLSLVLGGGGGGEGEGVI